MSVEIALANLFEHLIVEDDAWVVQVVRPGAEVAPYVQGAALGDGFMLEVSNAEVLVPPLTAMQIAGLAMHGFAAPDDRNRPNFWREYASLTSAREGAETLAAVVVSVLLLGEEDAIEIELFASDLTEVLTENPDLPL